VVVDHFHAIRLANMVVDQVRRRTQQATLGHRGRKHDPLYQIRKLAITARERLTQRGRARLRAGLAAGDPTGEVAAAWQGKELLGAVYAAAGTERAGAALERFYRWADGVGVAELSRLARTVRAWEAEILAFHATKGCSNGPTEALNLLIKSAWNGRLESASLVGHPRHTAGGATTGRSRPPWQESHTRADPPRTGRAPRHHLGGHAAT
jgi:transposase